MGPPIQPTITVGTVSYYSAAHIQRLFANLERTAVGSELRYLVCDNTDGRDRTLYELLGASGRIVPFSPRNPRRRKRERASASYAHGLGLNRLLQEVETDLCLFCDPDCLMLVRGWDVLGRSLLSADRIAAVGTPHHSRKLAKYHGFPSPIWILFSTGVFRAMGADWTPYTDNFATYACDQARRLVAIVSGWGGERLMGHGFYASSAAAWLRSIVGGSSKDTGWKVPGATRAHGYSARLFEPVSAAGQLASRYRAEPSVMQLAKRFELYLWRGVPVITHYHGVRHRQQGDVEASTREWQRLAASVAQLSEEANAGRHPLDWSDATPASDGNGR